MPAELLNVTGEELHKIDGVSWSSLYWMDKSPAAYRYHKTHERPRTANMDFGTIAHRYILENKPIVPGANANRGTKAFEKEQAEYPGSLLVNSAEEEMLDAWLNGYRANEYYGEFQHDPKIEQAIVWTDPDTGIRCKGKIDLFTDSILLDLKTTKDDSEHAYWLAFAKYRTHCQLAMYKDALYELDGNDRRCIVGRLEKQIPYDTMFSLLRPEVVWAGRRRYKKLLKDLATCLETDQWPGKGKNTVQLDQFPEWQLDKDMAL